MPFHILACQTGHSEPSFVARLLLPAGATTHDLEQDLRTHFTAWTDALRLCSAKTPWRGLPSEGVELTPEECAFVPTIPDNASNFEDLVATSQHVGAISVHCFDEGRWVRVQDPEGENVTEISEAPLFKLSM